MDREEAKELADLLIETMKADSSTYYGQGRFYMLMLLDKFYDEGFEITVRKK